jgi:hypothetical protein
MLLPNSSPPVFAAPYNCVMPLALVALVLVVPMFAHAETSTRCWQNGATTLCETMPPPAANSQPRGSQQQGSQQQGSQSPKITTCWRHGAKVRCQTW